MLLTSVRFSMVSTLSPSKCAAIFEGQSALERKGALVVMTLSAA